MAGEHERVLQHFCTLITGELGLQEVEEGKWETGNPLSGSDGLPSLDWGDLNNPLGRRQEHHLLPARAICCYYLVSSCWIWSCAWKLRGPQEDGLGGSKKMFLLTRGGNIEQLRQVQLVSIS